MTLEQFLPEISPTTQAFFRTLYASLMGLLLLLTTPLARRFFVTETWGGYAQPRPETEWIQNPRALPLVLGLWYLAIGHLLAGRETVLWAGVNLALCWYFFVFMRWRGILRGMGAPGYMSYWLGACVFSLELARALDPSGHLLRVALLSFQLDFAVIMTCAGTYKGLAGYRKGHGMELGMVNPWWGYWSDFLKTLPPDHWFFRPLNPMAVFVQAGAGLLMMIPETRLLGAALIIVGFAGIAAQVRLGVLSEKVMLCGVLFFHPGSAPDQWIASHLSPWLTLPEQTLDAPALVIPALLAFYWTYILLLPLAKFGQYYNFLAQKPLPRPLQWLLERWTNTWGIIIWRVFSVDVINFFTRIYIEEGARGTEREYTTLGRPFPIRGGRYFHVGEFVCLASLFTTMKYYPSQPELFHRRLVAYARSLPFSPGDRIRFEVFSVVKEPEQHGYVHVADYRVDPEARTVEEVIRHPGFDPRRGHEVSPVHEGLRPGTYAPGQPSPPPRPPSGG